MSLLLKIVFLAIVQGIAEFLPISSSGHLAIIQNFFHINGDDAVLVSIVLHAGTLVAILIYYFHEIISILIQKKWNVIRNVIIGTIPVVIVGFTIKLLNIEELFFSSVYIAGFGLIITALLLKFGINRKGGEKQIEDVSLKDTLFIGLFQAFAIVPGISRSGSTISGGLVKGLKSCEAAKYSFLLAIPAIGGATFVEVTSKILSVNAHSAIDPIPILYLIIGFVISAVIGYISLMILIKILSRNKLTIFAYYCFIIGISVILYNFLI